MIKVGVTGGIGSGKSTVCKIFETLGVPVYYADMRARELIEEHPQIIEGYKRLFGNDVYKGENGHLDRKLVARNVFNNKELLKSVNQLVHPVVRADFTQWVSQQRGEYVIEEAAILLESGGQKQLDKVLLVSAPPEIRIERVIKRDKISREEVLSRMKQQWTDEQRRHFCDFEIIADNCQLVIPQVINIHKELLK